MSKEPKLKSNLVGPDKIISKFVEDYKDTFFQKTRSMAQRNDLLFFEEGEELFRQGSDSYKSYSISLLKRTFNLRSI
jgi:NADPH-dependent 7-cyano-7-deazaguanine reductase QueF-like protein